MKLKAPTHGYQAVQDGKPKGKIHLLRPRETSLQLGITVCKRLVWFDEDRKLPLKNVDPIDICKRCLGPLEALP